ncbi:MAG: Eco57I restriction-modification methylase domain-containing protein [Phycisphaerales bacterium]
MPDFLADLAPRTINLPPNVPYTAARLFLGKGASAIEVVACASDRPPQLPAVRSAWKARQGNRAAPLLLVVLHGDKATLCGPTGDDPPTYPDGDAGQAERICREALEQPDRHAALRCLRDALPSVEARLPGIRNEGFLATHELAEGVHRSAEWTARWESAGGKARGVIAQRGDALLRSLGFKIEPIDQVTSVLRAGESGQKLAVAILLKQDESPELQADRFSSLSPVSYALAVADRENIPYVLISQGAKLRLYPAKVGVGVGRRGRTDTYIEIHTGLLRDSDAAYLWLLFSGDALKEGGTLSSLLEESKRFAGDLAERLRDRIYGSVVPRLSEGIAAARGLKKPSAKDLAETYEMAMTVLFRLLFVAYAEDKDLLPYKHNGLYQSRSLKRKAQELLDLKRKAAQEGTGEVPFDEASDSLWKECDAIFRAVEGGNRDWGVPGYDGGLFSRDAAVSPVGDAIADASDRFFDFRVADLAMGSGHFLVAAVDRIERALTGYLSKRSLGGVRRELATLRAAANTALDSLAEQVEIEDTQLLRRQIARRCIYGVDYNPVAVMLARVSIWIHTFVPGLPLSLLDRTLVHGNSLVGVGTVKEIEEKAKEDELPLFSLDAEQLVGEALEPLRRLAKIADATNEDLRRARKAMAEAEVACNPARALCDIVAASRMKKEKLPINLAKWGELKGTIVGSRHHEAARKALRSLSPLHFPVAFPEVFLRARSGFDVVLGNPPWEEATLEEHAFWARHVPGLRGLNQRQQEKQKATLRDERPDLVEAYERELADADAMRLALTTGGNCRSSSHARSPRRSSTTSTPCSPASLTRWRRRFHHRQGIRN